MSNYSVVSSILTYTFNLENNLIINKVSMKINLWEFLEDLINEWVVKLEEEPCNCINCCLDKQEDNSFYIAHYFDDDIDKKFKTIEEATAEAKKFITEDWCEPENVFVVKAVKSFKRDNIIETDL